MTTGAKQDFAMNVHSNFNKPAKESKRPLILAGLAVCFSLFLFWNFFLKGPQDVVVTKAVAVLSGSSSATGTVTFTQSSKNGPVLVSGELKNLDASALRGFHIHQSGDLTDGCLSAGPHFNPYGKNHGAPTDGVRHVGDLGNIKTDESGVASFSFEDKLISLNGPLSIVGRGVVLHAGTDDLGRGNDEESLKTGNAGARAACGVIGLV